MAKILKADADRRLVEDWVEKQVSPRTRTTYEGAQLLNYLSKPIRDDCASKSRTPTALVDESDRSWAKLAAPETEAAEPVASTYRDRGVPVEDAVAATVAAIKVHLQAERGYRAIRVSTGVGKTRAAAEAIAADTLRRRSVSDKRATLYLVPTHRLGDEVAKRFRDEGVTARVFRGRKAPNPETPGNAMCLDIPAIELALKLNRKISKSCCKGTSPQTETKVACPLYGVCGYQHQMRERPDVWIGSHELLFTAPGRIGKFAHVVIDECFFQDGLQKSSGITIDELAAEPPPSINDDAAFLSVWRTKFANALRACPAGGVSYHTLVQNGVDPAMCILAAGMEWTLASTASMWPGMAKIARDRAAQSSNPRAGRSRRQNPRSAGSRVGMIACVRAFTKQAARGLPF